MRILMVVGKSTGGIGNYVDTLTHELRKQGHEVRIITDALTAKHFAWDPVDLLWPLRPTSLHNARTIWMRARQARRLLHSADIIHAHGHQAGLYCSLLLRRYLGGTRMVISLHNAMDSTVPTVLANMLSRYTYRRAKVVTGTSSDLVKSALDLGAPRAELAPIPSLRAEAFLDRPLLDRPARAEKWASLAAQENLKSEGQLVLAIGRIEAAKRFDLLIKATDHIHYPATVVVLGSGNQNLLTLLRSRGSRMKVHFLGAREDVDMWFQAASVLAVSSDWEARSLVVQEAMAGGLPVVATRVGGLVDLIDVPPTQAAPGILVPPGDAQALGESIGQLLSDPSRWYQVQERAREVAASWDNVTEMTQSWIDRYRFLLRPTTRFQLAAKARGRKS